MIFYSVMVFLWSPKPFISQSGFFRRSPEFKITQAAYTDFLCVQQALIKVFQLQAVFTAGENGGL